MFVKYRLASGHLTVAILIYEYEKIDEANVLYGILCVFDYENNKVTYLKDILHGHDKNQWHRNEESLG